MKLTFQLRHSQYEIVNQWMGKVSREMEVRLGGQKPRPEEVLTLMSQLLPPLKSPRGGMVLPGDRPRGEGSRARGEG